MEKEKAEKKQNKWLGMLLYVIGGNGKKFLLALSLGLFSSAFISITNPLALKYLFDEGIIRGDFSLFVTIGVAFVLIFTVWRLVGYIYRVYVQKLKVIVVKKLCNRMITRFYEMPYDEVIKKDQGYFLSRVYDEVMSTAPPMIDSSLSLFISTLSLVLAIVVVLSISWRASLTIVLAIPLVYLVSRKYGKKIKNESKIEKEEEARLRGVLVRTINSHKIAKVFSLQSKALEKINSFFDVYAKAYTQRFTSGTRYDTLSGTLMSYAETIAIIGAGYEMLRGRLTFGGFMGFMSAYWMVIGAARGIFNLVPELSRISGSVERLREFEESAGQTANINYADTVRLERVNFAYNGKNVLQDFDFKLADGERILILGPNGSGKTTLAHLVAGLLQPNSGATTTFPLYRVSAVIYPCDFIPGTVKDNVSFADTEDKIKRFETLARDFGLDAHLEKDPSELSAGQRKKLEIIMGLLKDSDIYIFDEPLAGIDISSKNKVMNEIFSHTEDRILIVIMHGDEQFHKSFDRILDLGDSAREDSMQAQSVERLPAPAIKPEIPNPVRRNGRKAKAKSSALQ
jgi:ABC-type multidrug transport system fused ATPase/permease subunit